MTVTDPSAWIFEGTDLPAGTRVPGVIASDVDSLAPSQSHPPNVRVLAHSPLSVHQAQVTARDGEVFYSDMTYYTDPTSRAGVWDSGTNNWIPALRATSCASATCPANVVATMTGNLLRLFGQGPAGRQRPSEPNWRNCYPPG